MQACLRGDPRKQGKEGESSGKGQGRQPVKGVLSGQSLLWVTEWNRPHLVMPPTGPESRHLFSAPLGRWLGLKEAWGELVAGFQLVLE